MPLTKEQIREVKNHIPTCKKNCEVFISVFDSEVSTPSEKFEYLIDLIDTMEVALAGVKTILETQL